jgi:hypothetical protein
MNIHYKSCCDACSEQNGRSFLVITDLFMCATHLYMQHYITDACTHAHTYTTHTHTAHTHTPHTHTILTTHTTHAPHTHKHHTNTHTTHTPHTHTPHTHTPHTHTTHTHTQVNVERIRWNFGKLALAPSDHSFLPCNGRSDNFRQCSGVAKLLGARH